MLFGFVNMDVGLSDVHLFQVLVFKLHIQTEYSLVL